MDAFQELADLNKSIQVTLSDLNRLMLMPEDPSINSQDPAKGAKAFQDDVEIFQHQIGEDELLEDIDPIKEVEEALKVLRLQLGEERADKFAEFEKAVQDFLELSKRLTSEDELLEATDRIEGFKELEEALKVIRLKIGVIVSEDLAKVDNAVHGVLEVFKYPIGADEGADFTKELEKNLKVLRISDPEISEWKPRFNIILRQDVVELSGELPGLTEDQISVEFSAADRITIKGTTKCSLLSATPSDIMDKGKSTTVTSTHGFPNSYQATVTDMDDNTKSDDKADTCPIVNLILSERPSGEFCRNFDTTFPIDKEKTEASLKDGILTVIIPRLKPKRRGGIRIAIN